ncbi:MAG: hypothetical protein ACP59X_20920 [Solidesulfovibrio sp. DCME]|uniref:hypothetical protein n=1 Tax=Solidesulfovibrio sp. DCME TaxID=3447380 RepID=UPI003D131E05
MFAHHAMFYGGGPHLLQVFLIVAVIAAIVWLRRRAEGSDRAGRDADAKAVALLGEVKATLSRLEDRVRNLETVLGKEADKGGGS